MIKNYDSVETCQISSSTYSTLREVTSCTNKKRTWLSFLAVFVTLFSFVTNAQTTLLSSTGDGGFENGTTLSANNWNAVNSSTDNWIAGSTPVVSAGARCAFISSTASGAQTWTYSQISSIQHMYYDVTIPAGETIVTVAFKWKAGGEGTTTNDWDNLKVFWGTTTLLGVPVANTAISSTFQISGPGAISGMYKLNSTTYNNETIIVSGTPGSTYRLVFSWKSDISDIANPPAALDEISLTSRVAVAPDAAPITFSATAITQSGMTVNWVDNSTNETAFKVYRSTDNITFTQIGANIPSTTSASSGTAYFSNQTGLSSGTTYYYRIVSFVETESTPLTGNQATLNAATYYWTGLTGGSWDLLANWNTSADGTGSAPTVWTNSDIHIIDGAGTTPGGTLSIVVDKASFTVGQIKITSNTNLSLASNATTTRIITVAGGPSDDFVLEAGSNLNLTSATNAVAFAFTGSGNTGTLAGTYVASGSTSNNISTIGGTGTLFTVTSSGNITSNLNSSSACITGNATNLLFQNGSNYTQSNNTTVNYIPTATWQANATATLNGNTTGTTLTSNSTSLGNLIVNNTLSTATLSAFTTNSRIIQGNLTVNSTGTGKFRAVTSGVIQINGNLIVNGGTFEVGSASGGVIVKGNTTIASGATLDGNQATLQNEGNMVNNGSVLSSETTTANSRINFIGTTVPQTLSGTGSFTGRVSSLGVSNPAGLTISTPVLVQRVNLFTGLITGSSNITIGTGLALPGVIQIGAVANTTPGGNFDALPTLNLGTGTYTILYSGETTSRITGFEIPSTRSINTLILDNTNGLTIAGGTIEVLNGLTLTNGIVTSTLANHIIHGSATASGTLTGGSATSYINGPIVRTISDANAATNYILYPVGKAGVYAPISLAPTTTSASKFRAEAFDTNTGTANPSIIGLSATRRWEAIASSGTFTDINVRLADASITATNIPVQATTAAGAYSSAFGSVATFTAGTPNTVQSNFPVTSANYTGFLSFADSNACAGTPNPGATIASSLSICEGGSTTLNITTIPIGSGVTYQWQSSIDNSTYTDIPSATNNSYVATPTVATWYQCVVTCATGPASGTSTAIQITFTNNVTATVPATRCGTGTVTLSATPNSGASINWFANATGGVPLASGLNFTSPSITNSTTYFASAFTANAGNTTLGAGATNSSSTAASFLPGGWGGAKTQYIINASELVLAGLSAGPITSLGFEPTNSGQTYQGFYVNVGHTTSLTAPTSTFIANTGLTFVYAGTEANDGFTPVANTVNNLTFGSGLGTSSSFIWDGTSNIVVSISWSRVPAAATATSTTMKVDNVGFVASAYRQRDNLSPADMLNETSVNGTSNNRPRFTINGQIVCSSPRVSVTATVTTPPAVTVSNSTATICESDSSSVVTLTSVVADYDTYVWSPSSGVTGNETSGWVFNPSVSTVYTLTASQTSGSLCANTTTLAVNVNPRPTVLAITPSSPSICVDAIQSLTVSGGITGIEGKVGSGIGSNTISTPFKNNWGGNKTQAMYTAAELTAIGMEAGQKISSIGYVTLTNSTTVLNDFTISAGFVAPATIGTTFIGGATNTVLAPVAYTSSAIGNVDFTLSTPLLWDGVSNLLIETCFNNNNNGLGSSVSVESSTVASGLNIYLSQDSNATVCTNTTAPSTTTNRPNLRISTLETSAITWSPITNLYTDAGATVAYVANTNAPTVYFKSSVAATAATYTATATTALGCFRTATTDIIVNALTSNSTTITACDTYTWAENSVTYTTSGTYTSVNGCNTETLILTITPSSTLANEVVSACDTYTWNANGTVYTTGGTYTSTTNCVTRTLVLTITPSSTLANEVVSACDTYTWDANGTIYTTGGTYTSTTNCVTRTLVLTINVSPSNATTQSGDTLSATETGATYQWLLCDATFTPINGATSQSYLVTAIGSYAVDITKNGCTVRSACINVIALNNNTFDLAKLNYYPNPVLDVFTVRYSENITSIEVYDLSGRRVKVNTSNNTEVTLNLSDLAASVYVVKAFTQDKSVEFKIVKK